MIIHVILKIITGSQSRIGSFGKVLGIRNIILFLSSIHKYYIIISHRSLEQEARVS